MILYPSHDNELCPLLGSPSSCLPLQSPLFPAYLCVVGGCRLGLVPLFLQQSASIQLGERLEAGEKGETRSFSCALGSNLAYRMIHPVFSPGTRVPGQGSTSFCRYLQECLMVYPVTSGIPHLCHQFLMRQFPDFDTQLFVFNRSKSH